MSALIMGFAWGMAGLVLMGVGAFADAFGMKQAMDVLLFLPAIALVLALFLPQVTSESQSLASGESDQDSHAMRAKPAGE
jgi:hypothetical protein